MKMQKPYRRALLGLCVAAAGSAAWWTAGPAGAQTAMTSTTTSPTGTFQKTTTTTTVAVKGIVTGSPESVSFSGKVPVKTVVVTDPHFGNPPTTVLTVDLSGLSGTGQSTRATYVTAAQSIVERPLAASDTVTITFPFYKSGSNPSTARAGVASFALTFDVNTMQMTSAIASLGSM